MTSKDEMPEKIYICNGQPEWFDWKAAPDFTAYIRADLSPPVPDDVAKAVELMEHSYFPDKKREKAKNILIRAASTPSAEVRALQKIPLSASTSGEFIAPDFIKGWNAAIEAITSKSVINKVGENT